MPRKRIVRTPAARIDVVEIAVYLGTEASRDVADRFLDSVERACERLARMPQLGSRYRSMNPALGNLRKWPVPGFRNHLVFYRPILDGIQIVRVLHGARELEVLLDED